VAPACAGYLGSWMIHTGILLIIIFFAYGSKHQFTDIFAGNPGDTITLKNLDFHIEIAEIRAEYRNDGTISQYIAELNILTQGGNVVKTADIKANHPLRHSGYSFYQERIVFSDSMPYILIRVKKTPGRSGVLAGSIMLMAGLVLTFCITPGLSAVKNAASDTNEDSGNKNAYDKSIKGNGYVN